MGIEELRDARVLGLKPEEGSARTAMQQELQGNMQYSLQSCLMPGSSHETHEQAYKPKAFGNPAVNFIQVTCMAGERPDSVLLTSSRELQMQCPTLKPMLTPLTTVITSNNNNNHRNSSGDIRNDNDNDNVDNNDKS